MMLNGKLIIDELLIILFVFTLSLFPMEARTTSVNGQKVLVISSYSPIKEEGNHLIASFIDQMQVDSEAKIFVEYMDCEASPVFETWVGWMRQLFAAYKVKPDVVVLLGNEAWSSYRVTCVDSWHEIPVVLGYVKGAFIDYENKDKKLFSVADMMPMKESFGDFRITGYSYKDFVIENLSLIKQLQPHIRKVAFCYDNRYNMAFFESYINDLFKQIDSLDLRYMDGCKLSTPQLLDSIACMDDSYAILSAGWYTDALQYPHAHSMLHNELARYTSKPVYQVLDQGTSNMNYIGGYFISGEDLGKDLALLTHCVLTKGFENSPAFQFTPSLPNYYINYPTLVASGIDPSLLPENTVFYNEEPSLWQEHPVEVILFVCLVILMVVIFIGILNYRKRKEDAYKTANTKMMELLSRMPDMATIYDSDLNIVDIVNPDNHNWKDVDTRCQIGKNLKDLHLEYPQAKEMLDEIILHVKRTVETGEVTVFNCKYGEKDRIKYTKARVVPFENNSVICFTHDVTPYVVAEKEILRLKTFLQSIMDNLPVGLFIKDVSNEYRYLFYNNKVSEFYKEAFDCMLGKNDFEVNDLKASLFREEDNRVLQSDKPISFNRVLFDEETGLPVRWAVTTKTRLEDKEGNLYIVATMVDTTDIRRNELELDDIRRELSVALDAGSLSAWCYDVQKDTFTSLYRKTLANDGLSNKGALDLLHPDDKEKYSRFMSRLSRGVENKLREVFRFRRGEGYDWFETYAIGLKSEKTGEVEQIIGTERNITGEMKRRQELEENKLQLDFTLDAAQIISWEYNPDTRIFYSPRSTVFEGMTISLDEYLSFVDLEDRDLLRKGLEDLACGKIHVMEVQIRTMVPALGDRWFEMHAVPYGRNENGKIRKLIGLRRDITDLKMTNELIRLRNKAEEANRLKSAFLANMSHEIRTPLNAIVGFSNLIAMAEEPDEIGEYVKIIETNNELLLQLVNDILDLSKIEAGQMDFNYSAVDLSEIFNNLQQVYKSRVKDGVDLVCHLPSVACVIHSEKNRLTQVLSNFLSNACKYTSEGSITMGYERIGAILRFYVADTGKGLAEENIPHVFERFAKFDSFVQGTGLGLSICESIIQSLDGKIGVDSELGKGSTFWFTIPYNPVNE